VLRGSASEQPAVALHAGCGELHALPCLAKALTCAEGPRVHCACSLHFSSAALGRIEAAQQCETVHAELCADAAAHWPEVYKPQSVRQCLHVHVDFGCSQPGCTASCTCSSSTASRHACALPAAQARFLTLPDELLGGILRRAWADMRPCSAAEEVRRALGLASMCRRARELLRAPPLPLALDFSAARLSFAQRRWLLDAAQAGHVEAAMFHSADVLWTQPLLKSFLTLHGGTLLHLSGLPLALVACKRHGKRPALDLSGLQLTKLGIDCCDIGLPDHKPCLWLWPKRLPGVLEELHLFLPNGACLQALAWALHPSSGSAGQLSRLHILRVTSPVVWPTHTQVFVPEIPLLECCPGLRCLEVDGMNVDISAELFQQLSHVRVVAAGYVCMSGNSHNYESMAVFIGRLCSASLQAADLCAEHIGYYHAGTRDRCARELVREMISRCGGRFAVEVDIERPPDGVNLCNADLRRLAWRPWPAPDAPNLPSARAAHEHARAWAAESKLHDHQGSDMCPAV